MTPAEQQAGLIEDLSILPDAFERLNYLVGKASKAEPLPETGRTPENFVDGCQAELWVGAERSGEALCFRGNSDAPTVAALAYLFCSIFSDCDANSILEFEPTVLDELGLTRVLTPNRQNGARQIVAKIKSHARGAS